jgi:hypothetical protein
MKSALLLATALFLASASHAQEHDAAELVDQTQAAQADQLSEEARQQLNQRRVAERLSQARRTDPQTSSSLRNIVPQASITEACLIECKRQGIDEATCQKGCRRN